MTYSWTAVLGVVLAIGVDVFVARTRLVTRRAFWTAYAIVVFFQLVVNGLLTGLHIVRYEPHRIVGVRIVHAPVEDLLFGFAMVLCTLSLWVWVNRSVSRRARPAAPSPRRAAR